MPSDKRARQRAGRAARMAELQAAQRRRRRNTRTIPIVVVALLIVLGGILLSGVFSSNSKPAANKTTTTVAGSTTTAGATTTTAGGPTTTVALGTGLTARPAPAISASCNTPASGSPGTTIPASGHAVSIVPAPATVPFPKLDGSSPRYTKFSSAPPFCIDATKTYTATVTTDIGQFTIKFLPKYAPVTVNNFIFLAGYHYYDGIVFHRVIPNFMDQGGDPTASGSGGPGYSFADELPASASAYGTGAVAMANSGPNTNGSQFFIVVPGGGGGLSPAYSVFGQVTSGMDIVEKINSDGAQSGTPTVYHKIVSISLTES